MVYIGTPDMVKSLEVDYAFTKKPAEFKCLLTSFLGMREAKPFSLVMSPSYVYLRESLVRTVDANKTVEIFGNVSRLKHFIAPEWLKEVIETPEDAIAQIQYCFDLIPEQIQIKNEHDNVKYIMVRIPDINANIQFVERAMSFFGYFCSYREQIPVKYQTVNWMQLQFEPHYQEVITPQILENYKYLFHVSPTKYEHKILKNGICPTSKNDMFDYPARVYMTLEYRENENGVIEKNTIVNLRNICRMLYRAKSIKGNTTKYDKLYSIYKIDVSKLNEDINLSYDENFYPLAIFTPDNIPPYTIELLEHYNIEYNPDGTEERT